MPVGFSMSVPEHKHVPFGPIETGECAHAGELESLLTCSDEARNTTASRQAELADILISMSPLINSSVTRKYLSR